MKYYTTKYALTKGINHVELEIRGTDYAYESRGKSGWFKIQHRPGEYHETEQEAIAAAEAMRVKKLASLHKQIAKLEKMKFGE